LSLRQAWQAAVEDIPLTEYAKHHQELKAALEMFGE
jgi:ribulose 1,5-bisphosphate carboxylase large subunit-like protein